MEQREIRAFFAAFGNGRARDLVRHAMITHYTEAILLHHPQSRGLSEQEIHHQCTLLWDGIFREVWKIRPAREKLPSLISTLSRTSSPRSHLWFEDFDVAYEHYKHNGKLFLKGELFAPYLTGDSYCDIGCGGGDLVAHVKKNFPWFRTCTGVDVLDWRTENLKHEIDFQMFDFSKPGGGNIRKYDMATCIAMLHHVGSNDRSRIQFLQNVRGALSQNGRLLVEEDVLLPREEIRGNGELEEWIRLLGAEQSHFSEYLNLPRRDQKDVLTIIDLLANSLVVGVQDMSFPFGFNSLNDWIRIFRASGYVLEHVKINGFTRGMFNRSSHVIFVLKPDQNLKG